MSPVKIAHGVPAKIKAKWCEAFNRTPCGHTFKTQEKVKEKMSKQPTQQNKQGIHYRAWEGRSKGQRGVGRQRERGCLGVCVGVEWGKIRCWGVGFEKGKKSVQTGLKTCPWVTYNTGKCRPNSLLVDWEIALGPNRL